MKKVIIHKRQENYIDIAEIDEDFKGIIIAYKNEKPVGFFRYDYDCEYPWFLSDQTKNQESLVWNTEGDNFYEAVMNGIENKIFDELKVIEFE